MGMLLGLTFIAGTLAPHRSVADNNACWGDNSRHDISCARLTESLLLSLRGESRQQVQKAMNAPGVERQKHWLHFLSNYLKGDRYRRKCRTKRIHLECLRCSTAFAGIPAFNQRLHTPGLLFRSFE
jgi:hypothetical protein